MSKSSTLTTLTQLTSLLANTMLIITMVGLCKFSYDVHKHIKRQQACSDPRICHISGDAREEREMFVDNVKGKSPYKIMVIKAAKVINDKTLER